ncbi:MAG: F0F1 ATP synthase subunit delta [Pseudomonadota bacterium]
MNTGESAITSEAGERYARALFELADEAGSLDAVEKEVAALGSAFAESADLRRAMSSPLFKAEQKAAAINALAEKLGLGDLVRNFVAVMARNGRAHEAPAAARAFQALMAKRRGATSADVASADPLTAAQLKELGTALKSALGRDVEVRTEVRPELIGGLIVKVGSRMFDSSLRTKLDGVRKAMKEA